MFKFQHQLYIIPVVLRHFDCDVLQRTWKTPKLLAELEKPTKP